MDRRDKFFGALGEEELSGAIRRTTGWINTCVMAANGIGIRTAANIAAHIFHSAGLADVMGLGL